jgi:hypothetical protein
MVRTGSAQDRNPLVLDGHRRSPSVEPTCSLHAYRRSDLGPQSSIGQGSNPTSSAAGQRPLPTRRAQPGSCLTRGRAGTYTAGPHECRPRPPCHYRAIHSGLDRSPADNHGQRHSDLDLRRSPPSQVTDRPDLACKQGVSEDRLIPEPDSAQSVFAPTAGGLLAICWQLGPGRGLASLFVLVGVTGIEPVTSAV